MYSRWYQFPLTRWKFDENCKSRATTSAVDISSRFVWISTLEDSQFANVFIMLMFLVPSISKKSKFFFSTINIVITGGLNCFHFSLLQRKNKILFIFGSILYFSFEQWKRKTKKVFYLEILVHELNESELLNKLELNNLNFSTSSHSQSF